MKSRLIMVCIALLSACSVAPTSAQTKPSQPPNIVFFLTDDQRNDFLGCTGHPVVKTPNIDRLAAQGMLFENMFVTTSICAASRATLFTGMYERGHRYTFGTPAIRPELIAESYPVLLRRAGYQTAFFGKYGVKTAKGATGEMFDVFKPLMRAPYFKKQPDGSLRHETELNVDAAIQFVRDRAKNKPFCISISFNASHAEDGDKRPGIGHYPWPKAVDGMYDDLTIAPPRLGAPEIFDAHPSFMKNSMNRDRFFWRWDTPEKYQINARAYLRMLSGVDGAMGRLLAELKAQGLTENTVVIYAADNGYYHGDRGFAGKWSHYEQSLRVPLIVYDPRLPASQRGKVEKKIALNVDIAPTMLDLAGVTVPAGYQGRSLAPLVRGEAVKSWRDDFFCEHLMNNARIHKWEGVAGGRYKYARYFEQQPVYEYLHDLQADPDELKNLATDPAHQALLNKMRQRCDALRDSYGGPFSLEKWGIKPKKNK